MVSVGSQWKEHDHDECPECARRWTDRSLMQQLGWLVAALEFVGWATVGLYVCR